MSSRLRSLSSASGLVGRCWAGVVHHLLSRRIDALKAAANIFVCYAVEQFLATSFVAGEATFRHFLADTAYFNRHEYRKPDADLHGNWLFGTFILRTGSFS